MHLQENYYFTFNLDHWFKVTGNVAQYPLHNVTDIPAKFEDVTSNGYGNAFTKKIHSLTLELDLGFNFTEIVAQFQLYHETYVPTKFEVATSND